MQRKYKKSATQNKDNEQWKYEALEKRIPFEKEHLSGQYSAYSVRADGMAPFYIFKHDSLSASKEKDIQLNNWKIHLSINKDQLGQAWDIIFPILARHGCELFKVCSLFECNKEYAYFEDYPRATLHDKEQDESELKLEIATTGDHSEVYTYAYSGEYSAVSRVIEGMQVTIYPVPGSEWKYRLALAEIESALTKNNINIGNFDNKCLVIGQFASVRHTGFDNEGYTDALHVSSYNPSNAAEVFYNLSDSAFLNTITLLNHENRNELIAHILNIKEIFILQDLAHFLNSKQHDFMSVNFFKHIKSPWQEIMKEIKNKAIGLAITKKHLTNAEHLAMLDILNIKRHASDPRGETSSAKKYARLQERGDIQISKDDTKVERYHCHK